MSEENSFGILIKQAMEQKGWTQEELAAEVGVARGTVNRWVQDVQRPADRFLKQLIDILELSEQEAYTLYYTGGKTPPERQNLPLPNSFFTGREAYLAKLRELLEKHRIVALSGLGGIGKTQIALKYAHRHHPDVYPTALWVNAANTAMLEADFAFLAKKLKLPQKDERELKPRIEAVKEWLEEHTDWLLIIDNVDELPIVRPFLPSRPLGYIVLTTRWQSPDKLAEPLSVEAMDAEDGRQFLLRRTNRSLKAAELDAVDQLVEVLGGHALALEQAGAYIKETTTSFADYLKLYEENRRTLLDQHGALNDVHSEHPLTVAATFKASFARVREISPLAEDILHFCAFLQPDAIPEELFQHDDSFKVDPMVFQKGIAALQRYSLIKCNDQEKTLSLHRLVQAVLIDGISPDLQKQWRERVMRALHELLRLVGYDLDLYTRCQLLLPHVFVCAAWTEDELTPTVEVAMLFQQASRGIGVITSDEESILLTRAISIYAQQLGDAHGVTDACREDLAIGYYVDGKYEQAEALLQQIIAVRIENFGAEDSRTISSLNMLRKTYHWHGKHEQAEALYQQYFHTRHLQFKATHPGFQNIKKTYADLVHGLGRDAEVAALKADNERQNNV